MAVGAAVDQDFIEQVPQGLYVGGAWREATGGRTLAVEDPGSGERDKVASLVDNARRRGATVAPVRTFAAEDEAVAAANSREGGREGIEEYLSTKYIAVASR